MTLPPKPIYPLTAQQLISPAVHGACKIVDAFVVLDDRDDEAGTFDHYTIAALDYPNHNTVDYYNFATFDYYN